MRQLKNINIQGSIKQKQLLFEESSKDKFDRIAIYGSFTLLAILPFLFIFSLNKDYPQMGLSYCLPFTIPLICIYIIYRKASEKELSIIESNFHLGKNRQLLTDYCNKMGYEKYLDSKNLVIYNEESMVSANSCYKISRIFILFGNQVYFTILKDGHRMSMPAITLDYFLKKDLKRLLNPFVF